MSTKVLIQARSTSTRLPCKIFAKLDDELSVLEYTFYKANEIRETIVIIPSNDEITRNFCIEKMLPYHEGSLNDLLERHIKAASAYNAKNIVRITSDCPLFSQETLEFLVCLHEKKVNDFTSNWPCCADGHDIDIFSFDLLKWLFDNSTEREHLGLDFKNNIKKMSKLWKVHLHPESYLKEWFPKISIDTIEDFNRVKEIYTTIKTRVKETV